LGKAEDEKDSRLSAEGEGAEGQIKKKAGGKRRRQTGEKKLVIKTPLVLIYAFLDYRRHGFLVVCLFGMHTHRRGE